MLAVYDGSRNLRELPVLSKGELLLENWRSAADALPFQAYISLIFRERERLCSVQGSAL